MLQSYKIYTQVAQFYTCQYTTQMYMVVVSSTSQPSEMVLTNKVAGGVACPSGIVRVGVWCERWLLTFDELKVALLTKSWWSYWFVCCKVDTGAWHNEWDNWRQNREMDNDTTKPLACKIETIQKEYQPSVKSIKRLATSSWKTMFTSD